MSIKKPKKASTKNAKKKGGKKDRKMGMVKPKEFELYKVWKSLPPMLTAKGVGVAKELGINDETLLELCSIRTQTEFAKRYGVKDLGTLSDWNRKIEESQEDVDHMRAWVRKLYHNVLFAVYRKAITDGDEGRAKFLGRFANVYTEKVEMESPPRREELELLRKIAERR